MLIFDADDYIGNDIAAYVNAHPGENGWIMTHGYKIWGNLIAQFNNKDSFCGTGNIVNFSLLLEDIPPNVSEKSTQDELFRYVDSEFLVTLARHGKVRAYYRKKERALSNYPARSAVHFIGHHESNDFVRRRLRRETASLRLDEAQKYAAFAPITQDLLRYFNILPIPEVQTPAASEKESLTTNPDHPMTQGKFERWHRSINNESTRSALNKPLLRTENDEYGVKKPVEFSSKLTQASLRYQRLGAYIARTPLYPSDIQYCLTFSEEKEFIWFRVAKVGTRTILDLFRQANIELTAEHPLNVYYPVNTYKGYFRFAFVRNPWDRLVSYWRDKVVKKDKLSFSDSEQGFERFVDHIAKYVDLKDTNPHLRLQSRLIDLNHIDFLGRFETFEQDLKEVMKTLDVEASIKKKNASNRKVDYRDYYTERIKDKVAELYKQDIRIFNYKF